MRIQLWSYNYDPEPSGIAPLSGIWARAMRDRGHEVLVIAAHPHYPKPIWGSRTKPYRERREERAGTAPTPVDRAGDGARPATAGGLVYGFTRCGRSPVAHA
jgi:hypothetical protein